MPQLPMSSRGLRAALRAWRPAALGIDARERLRVVAGVAVGLLLAGLVSHALAGPGDALWLMAPVGASAVIVFGLPASPLAQPWAVVGGNALSAAVGLGAVHWLHAPLPVLAALAAAGAVAAMMAARCLHPPGGAVALLTVLAASGSGLGARFLAFPVLVNSLLLVAAGVVYNRATGRRYPHANVAPPPDGAVHRFTGADIDAVLARYNQVLDIPRDDLQGLLEEAELRAYGRRLEQLRCADVMSREPLVASFGTPLQEAWSAMHARGIKALPVVDVTRRVVGIVTRDDFLRAADLAQHQGFEGRLRRLLLATPGVESDKPEVVGQIMTRSVRVASAERSLAELVPVFATSGHHHIPVIDGERRLVGILTQSDVVRALLRADPVPRAGGTPG